MCQRCGCADFIKEGQEAVLKQATAIIKEMGVTADNVQRFEDGERICDLIASKVVGDQYEELRQIAEWVSSLHQPLRAERSQAYAKAAREVFANLPTKATPQEVVTRWHQLEQLCRELGDELISSVEQAAIREAIRAVQHVHADPQHRAELLQRYHLEHM